MKQRVIQLRKIFLPLLVGCGSQLFADSPSELQSEATQIDKLEVRIRKNNGQPRKTGLITGTDRGGELLRYVQDKETQCIRVTIGLSNHELIHEYFFEKGLLRLAIVRRKFHPWNQELNALDLTKVAHSVEDRFYFKLGALTYWVTKRQKASVPSPVGFNEMEKVVIREAEFFMEVSKNRADTVDIESFLKAQ